MPENNSLNKYTNEELLDLLKEKEIDVVIDTSNKFISFLYTFGIEPGNYPVKSSLIHDLFKLYFKSRVSERIFINNITKYIPQDSNNCLLININTFTILSKYYTLINETTVDVTKSFVFKKHFENYLTKFGLKSGETFIEAPVLFEFYLKWCKEIKRTRKFSYTSFINLLKIYFNKSKIIKDHVDLFGIDKNLLKITLEDIERTRKETNVKRNKKIKIKISST